MDLGFCSATLSSIRQSGLFSFFILHFFHTSLRISGLPSLEKGEPRSDLKCIFPLLQGLILFLRLVADVVVISITDLSAISRPALSACFIPFQPRANLSRQGDDPRDKNNLGCVDCARGKRNHADSEQKRGKSSVCYASCDQGESPPQQVGIGWAVIDDRISASGGSGGSQLSRSRDEPNHRIGHLKFVVVDDSPIGNPRSTNCRSIRGRRELRESLQLHQSPRECGK